MMNSLISEMRDEDNIMEVGYIIGHLLLIVSEE